MTTDTKTRIIELEQEFWNAIQRKDGATAARMSTDDCVVVGAQGVAAVDRKTMSKLTEEGDWTIDRYKFDEGSAQVKMLGDDIALIAYKVTESLHVDGKPITLEANDSSVWTRQGRDWLCAMHTESVSGDPFGRDRK